MAGGDSSQQTRAVRDGARTPFRRRTERSGANKHPRGQGDARPLVEQDQPVTSGTPESAIERQLVGPPSLRLTYNQLVSASAELEDTHEELAAANSELEALNEQLAATVRERDEAEQKRGRMEAEVIRAHRLESLRVMAGGIAHDFNNLLTSIIGNANVLLDDLPRDSESWGAAAQIEKAGQHAAGLVKQMLAFCGKETLTTEPIDLSGLVGDSMDLLRASIPKTTELRSELAEDLPAIEADATQVRQVLINLVVNASEAIGDAVGVIRISTRGLDAPAGKSVPLLPHGCVRLCVGDTGDGMSPETKARMFEPFFTTKFAGRGLGLAAVHGIVRAHRGSIHVRSRPAQGTEIEVQFPSVARRVARPN